MTWTTSILSNASDFEVHQSRWQSIFESRSEQAEIAFLDARWIAATLTHFPESPCLIAFYEQGPIRIAVLLCQRGKLKWQAYIPSQLPVSAMVTSQSQIDKSVWQQLLKKLPLPALQLDLPQLDPNLIQRSTEQTLDYIETAWVSIDEPFETYWSSRSKNFRANHKKMHNRMKADDLTPRFTVVTAAGDMKQALASYGELEKTGWKNDRGTAIGGSNPQLSFYADAFERLAATGQAKVYQYHVDEQLIASDLAIEAGSVQVVLKTAYAESHHHLSPSTLMRYEAFQHLFNEGKIKRIEFYGKKLEWHTRWTDTSRVLFHQTLYRNAVVAAMIQRIKK